MPRPIRLVVPGEPHHVTHRGNNRRSIFLDASCFYVYLGLLRERCYRYKISILGFCLMPNHIHLIVKPPNKESLAQSMCEIARGYTGYMNGRYRRSGHLWERRYYSCPLESDHLWRALRYVERNPVRGGLVRDAWDYPWSSAMVHTNQGAWHQCQAPLPLEPVQEPWDPDFWREFIKANDQQEDLRQIRDRTHRGKPWGSEAFVTYLQDRFDQKLKPWTTD